MSQANPDNASLWAEADVYIADSLNADTPEEGEPFPASWDIVGLLDGEDGFQQEREEDENDHFAWGGVLVRTSRSGFKLTEAFSALEDNPRTRSLIWPGSPPGRIIVPRPVPVKMAFETREGTRTHRLITERYAIVTVNGTITRNETELTKYELLATIYPTADGGLFIEQGANDTENGSGDNGGGGGDD